MTGGDLYISTEDLLHGVTILATRTVHGTQRGLTLGLFSFRPLKGFLNGAPNSVWTNTLPILNLSSCLVH